MPHGQWRAPQPGLVLYFCGGKSESFDGLSLPSTNDNSLQHSQNCRSCRAYSPRGGQSQKGGVWLRVISSTALMGSHRAPKCVCSIPDTPSRVAQKSVVPSMGWLLSCDDSPTLLAEPPANRAQKEARPLCSLARTPRLLLIRSYEQSIARDIFRLHAYLARQIWVSAPGYRYGRFGKCMLVYYPYYRHVLTAVLFRRRRPRSIDQITLPILIHPQYVISYQSRVN